MSNRMVPTNKVVATSTTEAKLLAVPQVAKNELLPESKIDSRLGHWSTTFLSFKGEHIVFDECCMISCNKLSKSRLGPR